MNLVVFVEENLITLIDLKRQPQNVETAEFNAAMQANSI
jgi:hypothetical protein